jgi:hypothetical protein
MPPHLEQCQPVGQQLELAYPHRGWATERCDWLPSTSSDFIAELSFARTGSLAVAMIMYNRETMRIISFRSLPHDILVDDLVEDLRHLQLRLNIPAKSGVRWTGMRIHTGAFATAWLQCNLRSFRPLCDDFWYCRDMVEVVFVYNHEILLHPPQEEDVLWGNFEQTCPYIERGGGCGAGRRAPRVAGCSWTTRSFPVGLSSMLSPSVAAVAAAFFSPEWEVAGKEAARTWVAARYKTRAACRFRGLRQHAPPS